MDPVHENIYIIPEGRVLTKEKQDLLEYYRKNNQKIKNAIDGKDHTINIDDINSFLAELENIAMIRTCNIQSIKEKARHYDSLFQNNIQKFQITKESPVFSIKRPATYSSKPNWRNFIIDVLQDFLRDGVVVIKKNEQDTTGVNLVFPFSNEEQEETEQQTEQKT